jgi:tRNA pseudouridine32 synthase/23S rRNA pseudouridine746 synthase
LREIGHAILGDDLYASKELQELAPRLMLHAETLSFTHPATKKQLTLTANCPF